MVNEQWTMDNDGRRQGERVTRWQGERRWMLGMIQRIWFEEKGKARRWERERAKRRKTAKVFCFRGFRNFRMFRAPMLSAPIPIDAKVC